MKKFVLYFLIAVLTFIGFIAVFTPASLIWKQVEAPLLKNVPELSVASVRGTVWQGNADLYYRRFPSSQLDWQLAAAPLLSQEAVSVLRLSGEGHQFDAQLTATAKSLVVHSLIGSVDAQYINRVSQPQGLTFVGRVDVEKLNLSSDLAWIQDVSGRITWPGGKIVSRTIAAGTQVFDLPALVGDLSMEGRNIQLNLHANNPTESLVEIMVKPDGWVVVAVKARLFDIAGLPWPAGSSLEDTVLQFEEKLLRGAR